MTQIEKKHETGRKTSGGRLLCADRSEAETRTYADLHGFVSAGAHKKQEPVK